MEEYKTEEEISLKELITILLEGWKLIANIVILGAILSIVYSFLITKPIYETSAEFFMNIPEAKTTESGVYRYPSTNAHDYFELIKNAEIVDETMSTYSIDGDRSQFVKELSIVQEKDLNTIKISYRGEKPEIIAKILDSHILNYQRYLSFHFREDAINQFLTEQKVLLSLNEEQLLTLKEQLISAKNQLDGLTPTIPLQKALTSSPEVAAQFARDNGLTVAELSNQLLISEIVNSNYTAIEKLVNNLETSISTLEIEIFSLQNRISVLQEEQLLLSESEVFEESKSEFLSVLSLPIKQVAPSIVPLNRVSPNRTLNVAIAIVVFGMIAIFVVIFRAYWIKN